MAGVIADASPLIALHQIGQISLIKRLFGPIVIPSAVAREVSPSLPALPAWIKARDLTQPLGPEILKASLGEAGILCKAGKPHSGVRPLLDTPITHGFLGFCAYRSSDRRYSITSPPTAITVMRAMKATISSHDTPPRRSIQKCISRRTRTAET